MIGLVRYYDKSKQVYIQKIAEGVRVVLWWRVC